VCSSDLDLSKKYEGIRNLGWSEDSKKPLSDNEFELKSKIAGMFIMISSVEMPKEEVLPYYYARQRIEQIFDTSKNYAKLLPLGVHSVETFNGHLLLSFLTTIAYLQLQKIFHKQKFNPIDFITEMRGVTCGVYEDYLRIYELTANQKKILNILGMEIPTTLPIVKAD
jgi:transposase